MGGQDVHDFDAIFDPCRLYVPVISNCSNYLFESENKRIKCRRFALLYVFAKFVTVWPTQLCENKWRVYFKFCLK